MKSFLRTKDFAVSQETFDLHYSPELEMLVTHPQPRNLKPYYESASYISHTDSKSSIADRLYQSVKRYSLTKKIQLVDNQIYKSRKLLDFGAGTADFLVMAKSKGFQITGIEPNPKARANAKNKGIDLYENVKPILRNRYNVITLWHVLEHLPNLEPQISQIVSLLDKNGTIVVAVPNFKSYDAHYYGTYWAAYDVPRHLWHFSKGSIAKLFGKHQMQVVCIKPMIFDSFYVSLLSEKYKGNKLVLVKAFLIGLVSNIKAFFSGEYSSLIYIIKKKK